LLTEGAGGAALGACPAWVLPNADASGYYHWSLPPGDLRKLTGAAYRRLSGARAHLGWRQRARRRCASGALGFAGGMAAHRALAADPDPQVPAYPSTC